MAFLFGKWRALKDQEQARGKYGENSELMLKHKNEPQKTAKKPIHSFPYLLNKSHKVKKLKVREFPVVPRRSFYITDEQKIQNALRNAAKLTTSLDEGPQTRLDKDD